MNLQKKPKRVVLCAFIGAVSAFCQTSSPIVADVYVQTLKGVNVYTANSAGKLTLVAGSPFATSGQMGGVNGKYLISVGTYYLHTYPIGTNGAVGRQVSQSDTRSYGGSQCGGTDGAGFKLDHTGKYFFTQLAGATYVSNGETYELCSDWQSYKLGTNGLLTYLGNQEGDAFYHGNAFEIPIYTISSNDKYAYGDFDDVYATVWRAFLINSNGELVGNPNFSEVDPTPKPDNNGFENNYFPLQMAADPAGHLALLMYEPFAQTTPPPQLASYTINGEGGIVSTNTWEDMPTPAVYGSLSMSTSGKLLASYGTGLQLFHFNGASPITPYSGVLLPGVNIDQVAWDSANHLYALSYAKDLIYVYTATPTSISAVAGSPFKVAGAYGIKGLVVVPK